MNGTYLIPGAMRNNPSRITETPNQNLTNNAKNQNADGKTLSGRRVALVSAANLGLSVLAGLIGTAASSSILGGICTGAATFGAGLMVLGLALWMREGVYVENGEKNLPSCLCLPKDNKPIEMESSQQLV
jgi:hypothetical protein